MPSKRLALISTAVGPSVPVDQIPEPHVKICGLPAGEKVCVDLTDADGNTETVTFETNGVHEIKKAVWAKVKTEGLKILKGLIVEIISKKG